MLDYRIGDAVELPDCIKCYNKDLEIARLKGRLDYFEGHDLLSGLGAAQYDARELGVKRTPEKEIASRTVKSKTITTPSAVRNRLEKKSLRDKIEKSLTEVQEEMSKLEKPENE